MSDRPVTEFGIDRLRRAVKLFDACNETFNQQYKSYELVLISMAMSQSEWDIYPDQWTEKQIHECLYSYLVPDWKEDEKGNLVPVEGKKRFKPKND